MNEPRYFFFHSPHHSAGFTVGQSVFPYMTGTPLAPGLTSLTDTEMTLGARIRHSVSGAEKNEQPSHEFAMRGVLHPPKQFHDAHAASWGRDENVREPVRFRRRAKPLIEIPFRLLGGAGRVGYRAKKIEHRASLPFRLDLRCRHDSDFDRLSVRVSPRLDSCGTASASLFGYGRVTQCVSGSHSRRS